MRIVAFADSLALPRIEGDDEVNWEETWPILLEQELTKNQIDVEVINCGARARTAHSLIGHDYLEHIQFKKPDIVIVQVGIVDCAPRIISLKEKELLNKRFIPKLVREVFINYRKRNKSKIVAKAPLRRVYTIPRAYRGHLQQFIDRVKEEPQDIRIVFLPILANVPFMEQSSPSYGSNLNLYNAILIEIAENDGVEFLELSNDFWTNSELYCTDGYHLSARGNMELVRQISSII